jgi:hypothetical protein
MGHETHAGTARILEAGTPEDQRARKLLVAKYARPDDPLEEWGVTSLPILIEFATASASDEGNPG